MVRKSFLMRVNPGAHAEYEKRHNPIREELVTVLKAHGVHNYSIHLDAESNLLFAYVEIEDEERWVSIAKEEVCQRWSQYMSDVMPPNSDDSPAVRDLKEVFYLA